MKKERLFPIGSAAILGLGLLLTGCSSNTARVDEQEWTTTEKVEYTKGLITYLEETEPEQFRITDEQIVDRKEDSRVIATYLDGHTDTLTIEETKEESGSRRHRSGMHSIIMMGMMGRMMGGGSGVSAAAYKDNATYQKSQSNAGKTLNQTAKRTQVRTPKTRTTTKPRSSSKGYGGGSSRSTRSFGG